MKPFLISLVLAALAIMALVASDAHAQPVKIGSVTCEARFSPNGGITDGVVLTIDSAKHSIRLIAFNFTSLPIANALVMAKQRGVDVAVVLDDSVPTEKNSALPVLLAGGIPAYLDHKHAITHDKFIVTDALNVEWGSFNYSVSAERNNAENATFCPSKSLAAAYLANWELHKAHSVLVP